MIRIEAASRLHFGLFNTQPPFGGIGVMLDSPSTVLSVAPADKFRCNGWFNRILPVVRSVVLEASKVGAPNSDRVLDQTNLLAPAIAVEVESRPPAHVGLGTGTALSLAVAEATSRLLYPAIGKGHHSDLDDAGEGASNWMAATGRGQRSKIGSFGYQTGGFIYETGEEIDEVSSCNQVAVPSQWRVVIALPNATPLLRVFGDEEKKRFVSLPQVQTAHRKKMMERVESEAIPSLIESDIVRFGKAVYEHNRDSGQLFRPVQGGIYSHCEIEQLVDSIRSLGIEGVGQTSWGPAVFAICGDTDQADWLVAKIKASELGAVLSVSAFRNKSRHLESSLDSNAS